MQVTIALETVLARAGLRVRPEEFLALVVDAARQLSPTTADPAEYFTPDQRAALTDVGLDLGAQRPGESDARAKAVVARAVLRDSALTVTQAAGRLGVDTSRVRHRLAAGRLAGWKDRGGWRLPAWQFAGDGALPGLATVLAAVTDDQPALTVAAFMTSRQADLVVDGEAATPREWLLAGGDPVAVARLASVLGEPA